MEEDQGKNMARMQFMNTEIDNLTMGETLDAIDKLIAEIKIHMLLRQMWIILFNLSEGEN